MLYNTYMCIYAYAYAQLSVAQHVFLAEMSIKVLCPFFDWVVFLLLSYMSCLHIHK